ncbi:efflux RND transporter periplasmic adaptor subunit [Bdellovibrio sp. SKB1291214]|uniref:efflux RND transporter periplasmic adaptor subunit n=1 Tax=Bdellovibrio sp. SKB1291214 TaxID=1732569 RepID=UPI000B51A083|nr:efflux RND transporter periplasmic adaptor subunit [Bdellovibrio sp. SKB1291214]UYL09380.1 efflux RND transporter periplasmic adaptor subunit [Bdellovibrio sp. SKB1291214]
MKNIFKSKITWAVVAILALGGGGFYYYKQSKANEVTYKRLPIKKGDIEVTILATGTVQPENRLEIKAPVAGRMEQVLVREGQKVTKGQIIAIMSSTERAAMLDAARAKGAEEYKRWAELYLATPIMAPINGTIILRSVEPGQTFTTTDAILTMSDRLTVKAQVDETDIAQIKLKERAEIVLDAYPGEKIKATADQIAFDSKTVNSVTTYLVDALPAGKTPDFMRSGMTANVTFFVQDKKDILVVASEALKVQNGKTYLLVQGPDGRPQSREVKIGISDGKFTEILEGAEEGEVAMVAEVKLSSGKPGGSNPFSPFGKGPGSSRKSGGGSGSPPPR